MMKHNDQPTGVEPGNSDPNATTGVVLAPIRSVPHAGPFSSTLLIFGAWLAGTLLFEISSLEDPRSPCASKHWGDQTSMLETWTGQSTEFAVLGSDINRVAKPLIKPSLVAGGKSVRDIVNASAAEDNSPTSSKVQLSSHETGEQASTARNE